MKTLLKYGIILCLTAFCSCALNFLSNGKSNEEEEEPITGTFGEWGLSEETEIRIRQNYLDIYIKPDNLEATIDDVWIEKFYGVYRGSIDVTDSVAVMMASKYDDWADVKQDVIINRILFRYNNENRILIWRAGQFYDMGEAISLRYSISLLDIANYHLGLCMRVARQIKKSVYQKYFGGFR